MNFKLRLVSKGKETEPKEKKELEKFTQNHEISNKTNRRIGSPVWLPICGEVKL